jgi:nitrous oxidase accessory protein NosD
MRRFQPLSMVFLASVSMFLLAASSARATDVPAGVGTLQAAIDAASPGDHLVLSDGTYVGPVVVNKPLRLSCVGPYSCVIDANCEAPVALDIAADHVRVQSRGKFASFSVLRGATTQIRIADHRNVELRRIVASVPEESPCGTEQTAIEVSGASSNVKIVGALTYDSPEAGILLSGLAIGAKVQIKKSFGIESGAGIAIRHSASGAKPGAAEIVIDQAALVGNGIAVDVVDSDGIRIKRSTLRRGDASPPVTGISFDATSDGNRVVNCDSDPPPQTLGFSDAGTDNCGNHNLNVALTPCS